MVPAEPHDGRGHEVNRGKEGESPGMHSWGRSHVRRKAEVRDGLA